MKNKIAYALFSSFTILSALFLIVGFASVVIKPKKAEASLAAIVSSVLNYTFNVKDGIVEETGSMAESSSPYWWVNSGGRFIIKNGIGMTMQGTAPFGSRWQKLYNLSNARDTDNGTHPQNIFRVLTRSMWQNEDQQIDFKIVRYHLSESPERYNPNGVLFFNRYIDGNNLYYTGIRVDGNMIIKKKVNGSYYTLAEKKIFPGTYNRDTNPTLLPQNRWMSIRTTVVTNPDNTVTITLYVDPTNSGTWTETFEAVDDGHSYGGAAITAKGYAGIRTDFMDVYFNDYKIQELK